MWCDGDCITNILKGDVINLTYLSWGNFLSLSTLDLMLQTVHEVCVWFKCLIADSTPTSGNKTLSTNKYIEYTALLFFLQTKSVMK